MSEQTPSAIERRVLGSWKEVAAFLRVTVRTAQRWERRRRLPVHRLGSRRNSRVLAYTDELAAWVASNDRLTEPESETDGNGFGISDGFRSRLLPISITTLIVVMVLGSLSLVWRLHPGSPVKWQIETDLFRTFDRRGHVSWEREIPGLRPEGYLADGRLSAQGIVAGDYDGVLHQDIDRDGAREWLINLAPRLWDENRGGLICLEDNGQARWKFDYGAPRRWKGRSISSNYFGLIIRPISAGGKNYILSVANHAIWFPSQVALLDPRTGRVLEEYWHPGGLFICRIWDVDSDGTPESFLAGLNNPGQGLGHTALVVLRLPFSRTGRQPTRDSAMSPETSHIKEYAYMLFPRPDTFDTVGQHPVPEALTIVEDNRLLVKISRGTEGSLFYYLDSSLKLVECQITESLRATHKRLQASGELDHAWGPAEEQSLCRIQTFTAIPDGNSPEVDRFWEFRP